MISKEELLKRIKIAIWDEERAYPIYQRHILQSMPWYGFSEEEELTIRKTLVEMGADTEQHKHVLENIYQQVLEGDKDVY